MTDRRIDDDDDQAWLLARERGQPGPAISEHRARRYAQLGRLIADLPAVPAGVVQHEGWERAVLAAIDADADQPAEPSPPRPPTATEPPPRDGAIPAKRPRTRTATTTAAVLALAASLTLAVFLRRDRRADSLDGTSPLDPGPVPTVTRGLHVEPGRLGFDHALEVRRPGAAGPRDLGDGDSVTAGDRIRVSVKTSADAYLYLAFCADHQLQIYPSRRGIRTMAGELVVIPEGGGDLVVDGDPGSEVLYLIVSRSELSLASPQLAQRVAAAGDPTKPVDCGTDLDASFVNSTGGVPQTSVLRGERIAKRTPPPDRVRVPGDSVWYVEDGADTPATAIAADSDGIAVVRYRFNHAAPH